MVITRSQLIIEAVERTARQRAEWSARFTTTIWTSRPQLEGAVHEMMGATQTRSRSDAPDRRATPRDTDTTRRS